MLYSFDSFTLDLTRGCLEVAGREVELRPKCFDILRHLVENGNRLISKEALAAAVWPQMVVSDESLARCISDVRTAIADHEHTIIKTMPRRGYLFTADVIRHEDAEPRARPSGPEAVTEQTVAGHTLTNKNALAERPSIAVLAFTSMSGDTDQEYFSDGITEDIITELSRFSELFVIARNSSFRYKGQSVDVRQIGRELGARYVLEGSVRRAGDRIRIGAQLIDATTGAHRWAERYDRKLEDTFAVQDEVARRIVAVLAVHVNKAETERALAKPPAAWLAYDHYLRAAHTFLRFHSSFDKEDLLQVRRSLEQALIIDPNYARAHALLSKTYIELLLHRWNDDGPWPTAIDGAYQSAREAVRLAPDLSGAHVALGWALSFMRQHEAAIAEFERATELNPNLTDHYLAFVLLVIGEPAKAVQRLEAQMRLDPFYLARVPSLLGFAYYLLGRYADALVHLQTAAPRAPDHGHCHRYLAATYAQLGQLDKAREEAAEVLRIDPWFTIGQAIFAKICKRPEDGEHFNDGLRKAGIPE
jgi:adenylate cyclase